MEEFNNSQKKVNSILQQEIDVLAKNNPSLKEMLEYSLKGGKRIRPIIAFEMFNSLQTVIESNKVSIKISNIAKDSILSKIVLFLEFLHSASLILDDLPCMDNDELRRGIPTFHKKYNVKIAYIVANFMIGKACNKLVKEIHLDTKLSTNIKSYIVAEIFDYNFLTSLGQIKDLDKDDSRESCFMNRIVKRLISNKFIKGLFNELELKEGQFEKVLWLNMKTFPLFYLSFLLPNICCQNQANMSDTISYIEHLALCFSIMFQICDDLEDKEKDFKLDKMNSHLKIIPIESIYILYNSCRKLYLGGLDKIGCNLDKNRVLKYFVEMLDKKIGRYNNG